MFSSLERVAREKQVIERGREGERERGRGKEGGGGGVFQVACLANHPYSCGDKHYCVSPKMEFFE